MCREDNVDKRNPVNSCQGELRVPRRGHLTPKTHPGVQASRLPLPGQKQASIGRTLTWTLILTLNPFCDPHQTPNPGPNPNTDPPNPQPNPNALIRSGRFDVLFPAAGRRQTLPAMDTSDMLSELGHVKRELVPDRCWTHDPLMQRSRVTAPCRNSNIPAAGVDPGSVQGATPRGLECTPVDFSEVRW